MDQTSKANPHGIKLFRHSKSLCMRSSRKGHYRHLKVQAEDKGGSGGSPQDGTGKGCVFGERISRFALAPPLCGLSAGDSDLGQMSDSFILIPSLTVRSERRGAGIYLHVPLTPCPAWGLLWVFTSHHLYTGTTWQSPGQ